MSAAPVTEADLQAYFDGQLPAGRRSDVEAYLTAHPHDEERLNAYRQHEDGLRALYDSVLDEPLPTRLKQRASPAARWLRHGAAAAVLLMLGALIGWQVRGMRHSDELAASPSWARRAAIAHVVFSPEVRHPVEVGADQETHLVNWLSKRLGTQLRIPELNALGYALVGGRLLPGERGPAAQFMYQDARGQRLTLYVRTNVEETRETAFRFAQEKNVGVFYWLDNRLGYALSGEVDKPELLRVATAVHRQLNP
jgi:anti-sigma factor RsiW